VVYIQKYGAMLLVGAWYHENCVQLKAFFHDKENDFNTLDKDTFQTLEIQESKWTPPEGQFASLDFLLINAAMTSINLISIVTPNFPTFPRKKGRHFKILFLCLSR